MTIELRLWLLCLLALLLPVQQAAAAAMLCPLASTHPPAIVAHAHCAETSSDLHHDRLHADGTCGVCAAFGSMMSLPSALPGLPAVAMSGTVFPPVALPAVRFIADPRERPPRTC